MISYCEEQYIHSLELKVKEQEAMIDWLVERCACFESDYFIEHKHGLFTSTDWKQKAQEAVKNNG